ncbi:MAG: TetR/AcrR family transcriptional regulator [Gordonia sp.]|uniref:TetR family transcriptional regulator n=1 Tax=Gordonia rubripertincta TaxID=36822 RepID=A0ABT4N0U3_GORRU|nr:TetR family transcriptional regulator [Gordonia rubripertincta]MBA4022951.1 TetR/AcrR family transcriptional regulator [Gordonia sp. (in: high G+C Gram-positive bacteria)]MCZ4552580.1 TetR family transcriptional regulator [Gordonia rubripertincta]
MSGKDVSATKQRIIDAARAEFADHGLAGARIDRIATTAKASKERLYAYYGDKESLFHAILDEDFGRFLDSVAFDADDLPGYAVAVFDDLRRSPHVQRLMLWGQLQGQAARVRQQADANPQWEARLDAIRRAQSARVIEATWEPADVLAMIFGIVSCWVITPGSDGNVDLDPGVLETRRQIVRESVGKILGG